jgi:hypothetical protein
VIDVNGDGRPDLVTTNESANNLSVLLGNGDGTFQAQKTFPTGQYPISLAVADFNGDGAPDLAVSNMDSGTVSILLNHNLFTGQVYTIDPPAQLAFTQPPGSATAGKTINPGTGVQVAVEDSSGTTLGIDSSVVTLTLSGGTFADGGTTESVAAVNGVATFSNLVINAVGDYTLTASDDALTGASSGKFTVCPLGDVIYAGSINSTNGAADIDAVYAHFGDTTGRYDLNGDSAVNQADVNYLVTTILQTGYGDSNLDHAVDFLDFQNLLNHWQATGLGWAGCDFNADGVTDFMDFQVMLNNWNPSGIWNSSEQASATASGSGSIRGAAAPANASQTASASMAVSSTPAADDLPASGGPLVGPVDLLATPANRNASIYVPAAKTTVLFHRAGRANASWTSDNDTVDLLTQLRSKPLPA